MELPMRTWALLLGCRTAAVQFQLMQTGGSGSNGPVEHHSSPLTSSLARATRRCQRQHDSMSRAQAFAFRAVVISPLPVSVNDLATIPLLDVDSEAIS